MAFERLSDLGRRVLGSLPAWHPDEPWVIAEEGGPEQSVRSHTLTELAADLRTNPAVQAHRTDGQPGPLDAEMVAAALEALQAKGLVEHVPDAVIHGIRHIDAWRMTQLGLETITAIHDDTPAAVPGAVTLEVHPAVEQGQATA